MSSSSEILKRQVDQVEAFGTPPDAMEMPADELRGELHQLRDVVAELTAEVQRLRKEANSE